MFKTAIKQRPILFCGVLISFFLAMMQIAVAQAATPPPQIPPQALPPGTTTATATTAPTVAPTPTTVVAAGTVTVAPQTVQAGKDITVTGDNWPGPQPLTIQVAPMGQSDILKEAHTFSDNAGHFVATVTIPADTAPGTYQLVVFLSNQSGVAQNTTFTVGAPTPTPSPSPSPTLSPTPTVTATPIPGGSNGGGDGGIGVTILVFALGSLGVILIITGVIMFAASSPPTPNPDARMR